MGVKISALPAIVTPALTDIFPVVQGGITYKETVTQLSTLIGTVAVTTITGTANQVIASAPTGAITLSLPQSIATTSDVTFGSVTFSPTTKGIVGTPTNNNAAATYVGEVISATNSAGMAITTTTDTNITNISLTAGDWDVFGNASFVNTGLNIMVSFAGISTSSATLPIIYDTCGILTNTLAASQWSHTVPVLRMSLAGTTTVYLVANATFAAGTTTGYGNLVARRRR